MSEFCVTLNPPFIVNVVSYATEVVVEFVIVTGRISGSGSGSGSG